MRMQEDQPEALAKVIAGFRGGKLTWNDVEEMSAVVCGRRFSRVTLVKYDVVRDAYDLKKKSLKKSRAGPGKGQVERKLDEKSALRQKIRVLREALDRANDRALRWSVNAYQHGMTLEDLDRPLSKTARPQRVPGSETLEACDREFERRKGELLERRARLKKASVAGRALN